MFRIICNQISVKFRSISRGMCYLAMTLALIMQVSAQLRRDGEIVGFKPHAPLPPFDSLDNFSRSYFPRDLYEQARAQTEFQVLDMQYASDGLSVGGVLIRPKDLAAGSGQRLSTTAAAQVTSGASTT